MIAHWWVSWPRGLQAIMIACLTVSLARGAYAESCISSETSGMTLYLRNNCQCAVIIQYDASYENGCHGVGVSGAVSIGETYRTHSASHCKISWKYCCYDAWIKHQCYTFSLN
jgi:hypothetical protein